MSDERETPRFAMLRRYPIPYDPPPWGPWNPWLSWRSKIPKIPEVFDPVTTIYGPLLEKLERDKLVDVLQFKAESQLRVQQSQIKYDQMVSRAQLQLQKEISEIQQDLINKVSERLR
jgi:hypothetical protein